MSSRHHLPQYTRKTPTFDQKVAQVVDTVGVQPRGVPAVDLTTRVAALEGTVASGGTGPVAASRITGTISVANLPPTALERLVIVTDDAARLALTTGTVQNGDTVKVTTTGRMWFVVNDALLGTGSAASAFEEYAVGTAASVPWAGITGKPSAFPPSAHTHAMSDITGLGSGFASLTSDQAFTGVNTHRKHINIDPQSLIGSPADFVGGGYYAPLTIWQNPSQAEMDALPAGVSMGMKIMLTQSNTGTPGRTRIVADGPEHLHTVCQTILAQNDRDRRILWGQNVAVQSLPSTDFGRPARALADDDTSLECVEYEVHNRTLYAEAADWGGAPAFTGAFPKVGAMFTNGLASTADANAAIRIWSGANGGTLWDGSVADGWWAKGIIMSKVTNTGIEFVANPAGVADFRTAFARAAIHDRSHSTNTILVEPGTSHQRFAYVQGSYSFPVIDVADCNASQVFRLRDGQQIYFDNLTENPRDWVMYLAAQGGLNLKALSGDSNVAFTVRRSDDLQLLQVKVSEVAPVYVRYGGQFRALEFGPPDSGGAGYQVVRVLN